MLDIECLKGKQLIFYEKLDGEVTVCSREGVHARSEDSNYKDPWQTWMNSEYHRFRYDIPEGMHICGENMYAIHSIEYPFLDSYFYVFNIEYKGEFLSVDDMVEWVELFGLKMCPYFYIGTIEDSFPIPNYSVFGREAEGYVVRNVENFLYGDFGENVAKCVRKDHVKTAHGWKTKWREAKLGKYEHQLLVRKKFRDGVFSRDKGNCVICGKRAKDAHHIMERGLWSNGGYYLENGASLCETHHIDAERERLTVEEIRYKTGIMRKVLPEDFSYDKRYNKWGKEISFLA